MSPPHGADFGFDEAELGKVIDVRLVRRLWPFLRPYGRLVVLAVFLSIVAALLRIVGPWIARHIIDAFLPADTPERVRGFRLYTAAYLGFLALMFAINFGLA